jgi:hypothetical protein
MLLPGAPVCSSRQIGHWADHADCHVLQVAKQVRKPTLCNHGIIVEKHKVIAGRLSCANIVSTCKSLVDFVENYL